MGDNSGIKIIFFLDSLWWSCRSQICSGEIICIVLLWLHISYWHTKKLSWHPETHSHSILSWQQMDRPVIIILPLNLAGIIASFRHWLCRSRCQTTLSELTNSEEDVGVSYFSDWSTFHLEIRMNWRRGGGWMTVKESERERDHQQILVTSHFP